MNPYRKQYLAYLGLRRWDDWRWLAERQKPISAKGIQVYSLLSDEVRVLRRFGFTIEQARKTKVFRHYRVVTPLPLSEDRQRRFFDFVERHSRFKRLGSVSGRIAYALKIPSRRPRLA